MPSKNHGAAEIHHGPGYLHITEHEHSTFGVIDTSEQMHALAALCLHEQPFGFSHQDVTLLRQMWHTDDCGALYALYDHHCECETHPDCLALEALADRIAALLPPEGP